ncbi:hypothetical protein [Novosphingobium sp.]|uniref:hypothetical protein n=1 Tax=Novosphingobium sp. TaxID=1874826 RepID=UPI00334132A8
MNTLRKHAAMAVAAAGTLIAAPAALAATNNAETINMVCKFQPFDGFTDVEVIWVNTATSQVKSVLSLQNRPGMHNLNGGGNVEDALARARMPRQVKTWPATITATTISWTSDGGTPRPATINRQTGMMTWSTPQDPTPPNKGTAQCTKGDLALPTPVSPAAAVKK